MAEFEEGKSELTAIARRDGWSKAIAQQFGAAEYLMDERRGIFLDLLPIEGADVLEIGPGFGQFTDRIAGLAKSVAALEVDPVQADFIREKLRQEEITNTTVTTGGGDCRLPYADKLFDLVVLNLVLEWCATAIDEPHEVAQLRLLREIARVLRPGGRLYVATKNRFALRYLIGKPDEHYHNMRFGSALPRWLADRLHGRRSRGRLYSWRGLRQLLGQADLRWSRAGGPRRKCAFPREWSRPIPNPYARLGVQAFDRAAQGPKHCS